VVKRNDNATMQIAISAIEAQRAPGFPYYFKCGGKTFMGIMGEVHITLVGKIQFSVQRNLLFLSSEEYILHS
jgi:hypothetical protein